MGFERVTSIIQGTKGFTDFAHAKISNYETDIFRPIFDALEKMSGKTYGSTLPGQSNGQKTTLASQPNAVSLNPKPVSMGSEPVSLDAKAVTLDAKPVSPDPKAVSLDAKAVGAHSETVGADPKAVGVHAEPVSAGSEPVSIHSEEQIALDIAFRVIADHIRTLSFAIADGIQPGNNDRNYVLRRILRRAVRYGRTLGFQEPFFYKLVDVLADTMGDVFPEIRARKKQVQETIQREEEAFNKTLDKGIEIFESALLVIGL